VPLNPTGGCGFPAGDTTVDEKSKNHYRQHDTDHRAPSFHLPRHIDSHVTPQILIRPVTLKIGFTSVNVSFVLVVSVVLHIIIAHDITSLVGLLLLCVVSIAVMYDIRRKPQCEPAGRMVIGKCYPHAISRAGNAPARKFTAYSLNAKMEGVRLPKAPAMRENLQADLAIHRNLARFAIFFDNSKNTK
jgi:hypothetical protein